MKALAGMAALLVVCGAALAADPAPPPQTPDPAPLEQAAPPPPAADQPTPPAPPPAPPATPQPPPTSPAGGLTSILGKDVKAAGSDDSVGKITDLLIDADGTIGAAVIDVGGFLGVGSRKIAVEWKLLHFDAANSKTPFAIDMDRAALQAAPEYGPSKEPKEMVRAPSPETDPPVPPAPDTSQPADAPK